MAVGSFLRRLELLRRRRERAFNNVLKGVYAQNWVAAEIVLGKEGVPRHASQLLGLEAERLLVTSLAREVEITLAAGFLMAHSEFATGTPQSTVWTRRLGQAASRQRNSVVNQRDELQRLLNRYASGSLKDVNGLRVFPGSQDARRVFGEKASEIIEAPWRRNRIARTESAITTNAGAIDKYKEGGATQVKLRDGPGCRLGPGHDNGPIADNLVIGIDQIEGLEISHPNCRRAIYPVRMRGRGQLG